MISKRVCRLALATAFVTGVVGRTNATEWHSTLPQLASVMTDLGNNASALTYWVDKADGVHVVTAIDTAVGGEAVSERDRHAILRFSALILPGQAQVISVAGPAGSPPQALRIRRLSNHFDTVDIEVDRIPVQEPTRIQP